MRHAPEFETRSIPLRVLGPAVLLAACGRGQSSDALAVGGGVLHLADRLDSAKVEQAPAREARAARAWAFDEERPEWRTLSGKDRPGLAAVTLSRLEDGQRIALSPGEPPAFGPPIGGIVVDLEPAPIAEWEGVLVRARSSDRLAGLTVTYNVADEEAVPGPFFFFASGEAAPVFSDGSEQLYSLPLRMRGDGSETLENVALLAAGLGPAELDILSVTLVPRGADFPGERGARSVTRGPETRRAIHAHAPASLAWRLALPQDARLDLGLGVLPGAPVAYRVEVRARTGTEVLLEETVEDDRSWHQRSIDLARWAGSEVELVLAATSAMEGAVGLWGAPIVSGRADARRAARPNVIFYVIDGAGADLMSLYGYNRRTTPFLERLAAEGVVFERAHSNSTWTQSSTASFMTSLHHSVLGGLRRGVHSTPVPEGAPTFAEHMRRAGYQTASFTSNPNAGRVIGLERGLDVLRDAETEHHSTSSTELHECFWRFREQYPGTPYWVHFQTTDVHEPNHPVAPFAGLFAAPDEAKRVEGWDGQLFEAGGALFGTTSISAFYDRALELAGLDRKQYFNARRALYDETMAYQDRELERFVESLKAAGEWDNTIFVVGADHGHPAGTFARFGRGLFEPQPEGWQGALFDSYSTRVPLAFFWPARIAGGRRMAEPVSMIDVLPTVLELAGLPAPEVVQGQSLAPALLGREFHPRPVILDEFRVAEPDGELVGNLEIIDGRWGASLEIGPSAGGEDTGRHSVPAGGRWGAVHPFFGETPRLLLYDLARDPFALHAVNDEHPELVEHYRALLLQHWDAQRALAQRFGSAGDVALSPDTLQQLQALGYIR